MLAFSVAGIERRTDQRAITCSVKPSVSRIPDILFGVAVTDVSKETWIGAFGDINPPLVPPARVPAH